MEQILIKENEVNNPNMASGRFRLNGRFFNETKLRMNMHRLSLVEQVSRATIVKYMRENDIENFSGEVLYAIMSSGFGLTPEQIAELKIGDVFEIVSESEA